MPPEHIPGDPLAWFARAESDLAIAKERQIKKVYLEDLCFHAQQCVEKSLKALILHFKEPLPFTHNLAHLLTVLRKHIKPIPDKIANAAWLTDYSVGGRYPNAGEPVREDEYLKAVHDAEVVLEFTRDFLKSSI